MKLAILSDFHLGYGRSTERENESFENLEKALDLALKEKPDALLVAGDLFDSSVPTQEAWNKAFSVFRKLKDAESPAVKITVAKGSSEKFAPVEGMPLIAIHGTHEFRSKDYANALDVLQTAGFLVYLHAAKAAIEKGNEKVVVHGLGGVPESRALDVMRKWKPEAEKDAVNILLIHQSLKEFLPVDDPMAVTLSMDDLPKGFDLLVNGHFHLNAKSRLEKSLFLMPGSTIITQMKSSEAGKPKGIYIYDTASKEAIFHPLPEQRELFYETIKFKDAGAEEIAAKVSDSINKFLSKTSLIRPLIRLKLSGSLKKGISASDILLAGIEEKFKGKAIISIDKEFSTAEFQKKIDELRKMQKSKKSIASMGIDMLEKNLAETSFENAFDARQIFDLLADNDSDKVFELLSKPKDKKKQ